MKEQIIKIYHSLCADVNNKHYAKFIGKILLLGAGWLSLLVLVTAFIMKVCEFVSANWEFLFLVGGGSVVAIILIKEHFADKQKVRLAEQEQARQLQEETDNAVLKSNYEILRKTLFEVTSHIHDVIHVKKPIDVTELNSPNFIVRKLNFVLYQYIIYPLGSSNMETDVIKKILKQEYARRLDLQSFSGIKQSYYFYEGQAEPIISVYEVEDNGAYLTVSLALTDENYCRHIHQRVSAGLLQQAEQLRIPNDKDF